MGLATQRVFQFISSLIIPLVLGIFTVVITFHQQKMAREQRLEDLNESRHQRLEDFRESRERRQVEEQTANRSNEFQRQLATDRYRDELLVDYIKDMATLLEKSNGSLIADKVTATVARAKTLTVFRQLDAQRNIQIVRFLYEAEQLTEIHKNSSLDLSTAKLRDIDFRDAAINEKQLGQLSLIGIFLSNATFMGIEMEHNNFANTQ
ncbi:unnamed protein product [Rotaria sp. Silwood2]|nr:unnamed protein product [Rotaria sp. Silwood2]